MDNAQYKMLENRNEINLIEMAAIFVRRRYAFYGTFLVVTLVGVVFALMTPERYEFVSMLQSAEKADGDFIEDPSAIVATLENRWVPEVKSSYMQQNNKRLPLELVVGNPENTGLIRIVSLTAAENVDIVQKAHADLIGKVIERQRELVERYLKSLKSQQASQDSVIDSLRTLESSENAGTALAKAIQRRAELASEIESVKQAEPLFTSRQSTERKGIGRTLIVVIAALLGGVLGIFLAFLSEFIVLVRQSLAQTHEH